MSDDFYRAFEEKYRGPRELILSRLAVYRPFISPLKTIYPASSAIDLGCGRGEWLELLLDEGFSPLGIDQDDGMLQGCREQNLPAQKGDAVAYLTTLPDESQSIISAFHVVEHISFDQLRTVTSEALRVLKPGGLLIMETPNPENIVVATRDFYLDPTHQRPIPPQLLAYLPEYYGFVRTKILRLQESKVLATKEPLTLNDVLAGASPDYAVIAQKTAPSEILALFDQSINQEYGLSMNSLAERYDDSIEARTTQAEIRAADAEIRAADAELRATQSEIVSRQAEARAAEAESRATQSENVSRQAEARAAEAESRATQSENVSRQAEARAAEAESRATQSENVSRQAEARAAEAEAGALKLQTDLDAVHGANHYHWQLAEARGQEIQNIYQSHSWRITAPLRWTATLLRRIGPDALKIHAKTLPDHVARYVVARPRLRSVVVMLLNRLPSVKSCLRQIFVGSNVPPIAIVQTPVDIAHLPPHARRIYAGLKTVIEKNREAH